MNELLNVDTNRQRVSARELHEVLDIEKRFSAWFQSNSQGFEEGEDFHAVYLKVQSNQYGGEKELQDYEMSMDMAKHICLMSRTEKGKEARQYLIDLEKAWNTPEQIMARALQVAQNTIDNLHLTIEAQKPKVAFFDDVADSKDAVPMNEVAKVLKVKGIGRNNLFEFLREKKILDRNNIPYQRYVDCGWFRVIEQKYQKNGETCINFKTLVYQKGIQKIHLMLTSEA